MVKNTVVISVSIPIEDANFLDSSGISPSGIFQDKIKEIRIVHDANKAETAKLQKNIEAYQKRMVDFNQYLEEKGLKPEDFYTWREKNDKY